MNRTLVSIVIFGFLLLFIFSPFAAFSGLLLILFFSAVSALFINIFQALVGNRDVEVNKD